MNAALEQWAAGHPFPETEAAARQAFASAGIDFDGLLDPLGRHFVLKAKREFSYARIDKVKAGGSIQGTTQKVTLTMQVVQVLTSDENAGEVARFTHTMAQQSGSDLKAVAVESGLFQGNTGAIGGTVTDPSGAAIQDASVQMESIGVDSVANGVSESAKTKEDGSYVVGNLASGFYRVRVNAKGFESFSIIDVHVVSSALTQVDVVLRVGTATTTVTVSGNVLSVNTENASLAGTEFGVVGLRTKSEVTGPNGSATITEQTMTPRLRHVFAETAYWAPSLESTSSGRAAFHFTLPDSLTTWKLHAVGSTVDGRLAEIDQTFKSFQPFFVDLETPQVLTVGDEISLPVNLRNYTTHVITLPVIVKPAEWFSLLTPANVHAVVMPNHSTPVMVGLRAAIALDAGPLRISAANAHVGDAVEKTVKVHPDGEPRTVTASVLLQGNGGDTVHFQLPSDVIAGSSHVELLLYPNLGANVVHAMTAVLQRPYGCAEQTISTAYASLLFLELAKAAKIESPEHEKALEFLRLGNDRLDGYFNSGGGLTYWGGSDTTGDAALTAYGIEFLLEAGPFFSVDRTRISGAVEWLLSQQSADGSWKKQYGAVSARDTLYIAYALQTAIDAKNFQETAPAAVQVPVKQAIAKATGYAATSVLALHDPYANALRLLLALRRGDVAAQLSARQELVAGAVREKNGTHWMFDGYSPFYGWGKGGMLESTALALSALQAAGAKEDEALENEALLYLLQDRDEYGIWMSGQATVRVMKALLPMAIRQQQGTAVSSFALTVNGQPLGGDALKVDSRLVDAPRSVDLSAVVHAGDNTLEFMAGQNGTFANAQISAWFYVPWAQVAVAKTETTVPGNDYGLDFGYACDAVNAKVGQSINCTVNVRRFGSEGYGMMVAEVGLPPGADVDRAPLGKLLDSWTISRYELQPDRIVFYLWSSGAEADKFSFRFTPRYAVRAKAAPSKLEDYYNPDFNAVLAPQKFDIN